MGRYTSQQVFADNNPSVRRISYDQAVGRAAGGANSSSSTTTTNNQSIAPSGKLVTERVQNAHGSTAGAGSSEFHIYRLARSREMTRLQDMDEEERRQLLDSKFNTTVEKWKQEEEQTLAKNRKKRQRQKDSKKRKKNMKLCGAFHESHGQEEEEEEEDHDDNNQGEKEEDEDFTSGRGKEEVYHGPDEQTLLNHEQTKNNILM